jgi:hypothetical protein
LAAVDPQQQGAFQNHVNNVVLQQMSMKLPIASSSKSTGDNKERQHQPPREQLVLNPKTNRNGKGCVLFKYTSCVSMHH